MDKCYVKFSGRLGNQLFQLACAYTYGKIHDKDLVILCDKNQQINPIFQNFKTIPNFEIKVTKINPKIIGGVVKFPYIVGDIQIWPYNHSLKFFEDYKEEFISNLVLPEAPEVSDERIAFHIRMGDYMNLSYRFGSVVKYFHYMFKKFNGVFQIDVYSDSPEVVKNIYSAYEFNIKSGKDPVTDMVQISKYKNFVGSNSTFSWWSSILGVNKDIIYFPDIWRIPNNLNFEHILYDGVKTFPMYPLDN